jgi:hypothetical protein
MSFKSQPQHNSSETEAELMDCLLASSTANYPWNPTDPETADYYSESDAHFSLDNWAEAEISLKSQSFFARIQSCWEAIPVVESALSPLAALTAKFGVRVPQELLAQIAANVSSMANRQLEPVDRLVQSVSDLLSSWHTEDLLMMARPYASAMRGNTEVETPDQIVRPLDWAKLTEVERAKLTIFVAQYAISELQS